MPKAKGDESKRGTAQAVNVAGQAGGMGIARPRVRFRGNPSEVNGGRKGKTAIEDENRSRRIAPR